MSRCGDWRVMSDHEGDSRRAELRGDPPPFMPEQLAWLEEYRPPMSVAGTVVPGLSPSAPPGPSSDGPRPRLVTATSVSGECYTLLVSFQLIACSVTVPVAWVGDGGKRHEPWPHPCCPGAAPFPEETVVFSTWRAWLVRPLLPLPPPSLMCRRTANPSLGGRRPAGLFGHHNTASGTSACQQQWWWSNPVAAHDAGWRAASSYAERHARPGYSSPEAPAAHH